MLQSRLDELNVERLISICGDLQKICGVRTREPMRRSHRSRLNISIDPKPMLKGIAAFSTLPQGLRIQVVGICEDFLRALSKSALDHYGAVTSPYYSLERYGGMSDQETEAGLCRIFEAIYRRYAKLIPVIVQDVLEGYLSLPERQERCGSSFDQRTLAVLEKAYAHCPTPSSAECTYIAKVAGITHQQVRTWFQNKRNRGAKAARIASSASASSIAATAGSTKTEDGGRKIASLPKSSRPIKALPSRYVHPSTPTQHSAAGRPIRSLPSRAARPQAGRMIDSPGMDGSEASDSSISVSPEPMERVSVQVTRADTPEKMHEANGATGSAMMRVLSHTSDATTLFSPLSLTKTPEAVAEITNEWMTFPVSALTGSNTVSPIPHSKIGIAGGAGLHGHMFDFTATLPALPIQQPSAITSGEVGNAALGALDFPSDPAEFASLLSSILGTQAPITSTTAASLHTNPTLSSSTSVSLSVTPSCSSDSSSSGSPASLLAWTGGSPWPAHAGQMQPNLSIGADAENTLQSDGADAGAGDPLDFASLFGGVGSFDWAGPDLDGFQAAIEDVLSQSRTWGRPEHEAGSHNPGAPLAYDIPANGPSALSTQTKEEAGDAEGLDPSVLLNLDWNPPSFPAVPVLDMPADLHTPSRSTSTSSLASAANSAVLVTPRSPRSAPTSWPGLEHFGAHHSPATAAHAQNEAGSAAASSPLSPAPSEDQLHEHARPGKEEGTVMAQVVGEKGLSGEVVVAKPIELGTEYDPEDIWVDMLRVAGGWHIDDGEWKAMSGLAI